MIVVKSDGSYFSAHDGYTLAAGETQAPDIPDTLVKPSWDGTTWVESATATEQDAESESYRAYLIKEVDIFAKTAFFNALSTPMDDPAMLVYKSFAHFVKGAEANEIINDRDAPPVPHKPVFHKGGSAKVFEVVESEAAERGETKEQRADIIKSLADQQRSLIATLEKYRPKAADDLEAYVLTGSYATDKAAMDAIYNTYVTNVNTALGI